MADIIERLRKEARFGVHLAANRQSDTRDLHAKAADAIESAQAEVRRLREALEDSLTVARALLAAAGNEAASWLKAHIQKTPHQFVYRGANGNLPVTCCLLCDWTEDAAVHQIAATSNEAALREMLERVSHINSFRELNALLPTVRALLVAVGTTDSKVIAMHAEKARAALARTKEPPHD